MRFSISKSTSYSAFLLISLFIAANTRAEEKFDPAARAKAIAPFIDENVIAVIHVDFPRVTLDSLVDEFRRLFPEYCGSGNLEQTKVFGTQQIEALMKAGVMDGYGIFTSTFDYNHRIFIMPATPNVDEKAVKAAFHGTPLFRIGDTLVLGAQDQLDYAIKIVPDPRPELAAAFEAAGDTAVQVIFTPPKHFRRVVEEIMPQLPKEMGGGESKILTQGCLWAALGIDLPPQLSLKLVIQSQDAAAASALRAKWLDAAKFAAELPKTKELFPNLTEVAQTLTPNVEENRLVLALDNREGKIDKIIASAQPTIEMQREIAQRMQSINNLKMIGLAMHNHHDVFKHFPAAASYSAEGKPLLSWRVYVLPVMDHKKLYNQFHLDEPWDSPNNIKLIDKMPLEFRSPKSKIQEPGRTNYLVPVGPGTAFEGKEGKKIREITDGTSHTIMAVEVDDEHAVIWTKPDDLAYDPKEPAKGLGGHFKAVFLALTCDGAVRAFPLSFPAEDLRAWFSARGNDTTKNP